MLMLSYLVVTIGLFTLLSTVAGRPNVNEGRSFQVRAASDATGSVIPRSFSLEGRSAPTVTHADGNVNWALYHKELRRLTARNTAMHQRAAAQRRHGSIARRASATVTLIDDIENGMDDNSYNGDVSLGTPAQALPYQFDTGSSDHWVPTQSFDDLDNGDFLDTSKSGTFVNSTTPFVIDYGGGDGVTGTLARETCTFGGLKILNQYFGAITLNRDVNGPYAGISGLGFLANSAAGKPSPWIRLVSSGVLDANLFTLYLVPDDVGTKSALTLGAINPSHFTGGLTYYPVVGTDLREWELDTVAFVNGRAVRAPAFRAIIDSGTSLGYLPRAVMKAYFAAVPGATLDATQSTATTDIYTFPCTSKVPLSFKFGGGSIAYAVTPGNLALSTKTGTGMCVSVFSGKDQTDDDGIAQAILGDSFMKNVYSVFSTDHFSGSPGIGFATPV